MRGGCDRASGLGRWVSLPLSVYPSLATAQLSDLTSPELLVNYQMRIFFWFAYGVKELNYVDTICCKGKFIKYLDILSEVIFLSLSKRRKTKTQLKN